MDFPFSRCISSNRLVGDNIHTGLNKNRRRTSGEWPRGEALHWLCCRLSLQERQGDGEEIASGSGAAYPVGFC